MRLRIECVYGPYLRHECVRGIAMEDDASLAALHMAIQESVGFYNDHPYAFYTANSSAPGAHKHWLFAEMEWSDLEDAFYDTRLKDILPPGRKKLYYLFDFGDLWTFEIRKMRTRKADPPEIGNRNIERLGPDPVQYPSFDEGED